MICNGYEVPITRNLKLPLLSFRSWRTTSIWWIDAICLDQSNILELNQQVPQMDQVFWHSTCTYIWLGEEDEQSSDSISFIEELTGDLLSHYNIPTHTGDGELPFEEYVFEHPAKCFRFLDAQLPKVNAFKALLSRPWFDRVWTFQESVLSRHCHVRLGHFDMDKFELRSACNILAHLNKFSAKATGCYDEDLGLRLGLASARLGYSHGSQCGHDRYDLGLLNLMENRRMATSRDPRDKLYALLAVCSDEKSHPLIRVDYRKSKEEVYRDFVRYCYKVYSDETDTLTLRTIHEDIAYLQRRSEYEGWGPDSWRKVVVCIVSDGCAKMNPRTRALLACLGIYQDFAALQTYNGSDVVAHMYEVGRKCIRNGIDLISFSTLHAPLSTHKQAKLALT